MATLTLFSLPNLKASEAKRVSVSSASLPVVNRPKFKDKDAYRAWTQDERTDHAFVSPVEGLNPHLRVSDANPPHQIHGLVLEYDQTNDGPNLTRIPYRPPFWTKSYSGHMRVFYPFEVPIPASDPALAKAFVEIAHAKLRAKKLGAGWEPEESSRLNQYYEVGEWHTVENGEPLPSEILWSWIVEATGKIDWRKTGTQLPIAEVRAECAKRWPDRWPGGWDRFTEGARGIRFWDQTADSSSVIVTASGCVCFTGDQAFRSWASILGAEWVERKKGTIIGQAIEGMWWESPRNTYWRLIGDLDTGEMGSISTRTDLVLHLEKKGLSSIVPKEATHSEVDDAIYALQMTRSVHSVGSLVYRPMGVVEHNGNRILNTSRVKPIAPLDRPVEWGEGFPWLASFLEQFFGNQLPRFLSWAAHFYQGALAHNPGQGLALILAGPSSAGKSFMADAVLRHLFGGSADCSRYLTGQDQFNATLCQKPIWVASDAVLDDNRASQEKFQQQYKRVIANRDVLVRGMYREGHDIPWNGRVVSLLNDDIKSLRMLPTADLSTSDKFLALLVTKTQYDTFPTDEEVLAWLPAFGAFLRDYVIPPEMRNSRFGVKAWAHPTLEEISQAESETQSALELLEAFREDLFTREPTTVKSWQGSATRLLNLLWSDPTFGDLCKRQFPRASKLGMYVKALTELGVQWLDSRRANGERTITIMRPGEVVPKKQPE